MTLLSGIGQANDANSFIYESKLLTNEDAVKLLASNTKNRKISQSKVSEYRSAMEKGNWQLNGQSILLAKDGTLLDGQHRLIAISKLDDGVKVPVVIGMGMDNDSFDTIDIGKNRSPSDLLSLYGIDHKEVSAIAAGCKLLHKYLVINDKIKTALQNKDIYNFIQQDEYKTLFQEGVKEVLANKANLMLTPSECLFLYVLLVGIDEEKGKAFCNQIFTGANIVQDTQVHVLQGRLKGNVPRNKKLACTIKAWNFYIKGKPLLPSALSNNSIKDDLKIRAISPQD